ncbi:unnamed protein product [Moneuplotes crassus]|uniref:Uncharacterized protein n=1 Tax=Euplotes crassus TaxID=5936 RepID=A0AAD1Y6S4_EUPCR|nr:unnamed protein product [Moneuplotes crassus]
MEGFNNKRLHVNFKLNNRDSSQDVPALKSRMDQIEGQKSLRASYGIKKMTFEEIINLRGHSDKASKSSKSDLSIEVQKRRRALMQKKMSFIHDHDWSKFNRKSIGKFLSKSCTPDVYITNGSECKEFSYLNNVQQGFKNDIDRISRRNIKNHLRRRSCNCCFCGKFHKEYRGFMIILDEERRIPQNTRQLKKKQTRNLKDIMSTRRDALNKMISLKQASSIFSGLIPAKREREKMDRDILQLAIKKAEYLNFKEIPKYLKKISFKNDKGSPNTFSCRDIQRQNSVQSDFTNKTASQALMSFLSKYSSAHCDHTNLGCFKCYALLEADLTRKRKRRIWRTKASLDVLNVPKVNSRMAEVKRIGKVIQISGAQLENLKKKTHRRRFWKRHSSVKGPSRNQTRINTFNSKRGVHPSVSSTHRVEKPQVSAFKRRRRSQQDYRLRTRMEQKREQIRIKQKEVRRMSTGKEGIGVRMRSVERKHRYSVEINQNEHKNQTLRAKNLKKNRDILSKKSIMNISSKTKKNDFLSKISNKNQSKQL